MKSVNRITLLGHLVADPQVKTTKSGKQVANFALATNNEWFDHNGELQHSVDFHRVVAWERLAGVAERFLGKGSPVLLEGRLTNRSYEGKDKTRQYITEVVVNNLHLLKWKEENNSVEARELAATA
ncbi:MAG: single-strand DNA-binding protein [Oceanicoccus sp.]|jgi:single-strand DNA-binding protein